MIHFFNVLNKTLTTCLKTNYGTRRVFQLLESKLHVIEKLFHQWEKNCSQWTNYKARFNVHMCNNAYLKLPKYCISLNRSWFYSSIPCSYFGKPEVRQGLDLSTNHHRWQVIVVICIPTPKLNKTSSLWLQKHHFYNGYDWNKGQFNDSTSARVV